MRPFVLPLEAREALLPLVEEEQRVVQEAEEEVAPFCKAIPFYVSYYK
jgi:hypothetical protein